MLRWFFNALYGSTPAEFRSDYDLDESVSRLAAATRRWLDLSARIGEDLRLTARPLACTDTDPGRTQTLPSS